MSPLVVALVVSAFVGPGQADEPKSVDLSELRDAVKAASKRGANVTEVTKALAVLEKRLAKGWGAPKADAPPPAELAALREAVETALKKGEDVDALRTPLDAVEKALIGRALAGPKPEHRADGRRRSAVVIRLDGVTTVIDGGGAPGDSFAMRTENGAFHFTAKRGGVEYYATGHINKNGTEDVLGRITDGGTKHDFDKLDQVPDRYRPTLDQLLRYAVEFVP